jgi:hypothetical protein
MDYTEGMVISPIFSDNLSVSLPGRILIRTLKIAPGTSHNRSDVFKHSDSPLRIAEYASDGVERL